MDFLPRLGRPLRARNQRPLPRAGRGRGRGRGGSSTNAVPQVKEPKGFFRETQDERNFRLTVLRTFKCPFQEEGTCKNDSKPHECLFAHPETAGPVAAPAASRPAGAKKATDPLKALVIPPEGELREIPPYACVFSLLNSCYNKNKFFQHRMRSKYAKGAADKGPSAPMDVDEDNDGDDEEEQEMGAAEPTDGPVIDEVKGAKVDVCTSGIHLRPEDLVDLDYFERMNPELLDQFFGGDRDRECSVCFEKVMAKRLPKNRKFAMLENCAHVFCVACIKEWRTRSMNCPVCRVESKRFATKSRLITDESEKKKYFGNKKSRSVYGERDAQAQATVRVRQNLDRLAAAEELFNMEFRVDIGGNLMFAPPGGSDDDDDDDLFGLAVASDEDDDDASITDQDDMFLDADDYDDYDLMFDDFERDRFDDLERGFGRGGGAGGGGGRVGAALAAAAEVPGAILEHVQIMINNGFDWAAPPGGRRAAGGAGRNVMITARRTGGGNVGNDAAAEARGNAARGNAARGRDAARGNAARGRDAARGNAARPLRNVPRAEEDPIDRAIVRDIGRIIERHERNNRNNNEVWAPRAEPVVAARARRNGPAQNNRRRNDNNNAHNDNDDPHDPDNNDHHWVYPNIRGIDLEFDFAEPGGLENRRLERAIIDIVGGGRRGRRARGLARGGGAAARDDGGRDQGRDANARGNGAARARNDGAAAAAAPRGRRGGNVPENANRNARGGVGGRGAAAAAAPTRNNNRGRGAANGGNRGRGRRDF